MKYYKTDSRKITFREYWNLTRSPAVLLPWLCKLMFIPLPLTRGIPEPGPFRDAILDRGKVPSNISAKLDPPLRECQQLGFNGFWFYTLTNSLMPGNAFGIEMLHESEEIIGKIVYAAVAWRESMAIVFLSAAKDGRIIATTNKKPELSTAPETETERMVGAQAGELWQRHLERLAAIKSTRCVSQFGSFDELASFEDQMGRRLIDYHVGRGVWVEMSREEVAKLSR